MDLDSRHGLFRFAQCGNLREVFLWEFQCLYDGFVVVLWHIVLVVFGERDLAFVFVYSLLVGSTSWLLVAHEVEWCGRVAVVPLLFGVAEVSAFQWRHILDVVRVATSYLQESIVFVGHSGAGFLLPAIVDSLTVEVAVLIFVDSFLPPFSGRLVLGFLAFMDQLCAMAINCVFALWLSWFGEYVMRELVSDERFCVVLEWEMSHLSFSYFDASVLLFDGWNWR